MGTTATPHHGSVEKQDVSKTKGCFHMFPFTISGDHFPFFPTGIGIVKTSSKKSESRFGGTLQYISGQITIFHQPRFP